MTDPNPMAVPGDAPLEPITPREAYDWYLEDRASELTELTHQTHRSRLIDFVEWCEDSEKGGIDNMNDVGGRQLMRFKSVWRQKGDGIKTVTLRGYLVTLRAFIKWCETIQAVAPFTSQTVQLPDVGEDGVDDRMIDYEHANDVLAYLSKFEYASLRHALFELLWVTGMRIGAAWSLDIGDFDAENRSLSIRHRPEQGTYLKQKEKGERDVSLRPGTVAVVEDYIVHTRESNTDEYGREPLFTSQYGRRGTSNLREQIYRVTQPCYYGGCPVGNDPETCDYIGKPLLARCPENVHPHAIRRGAITWALLNDVPPYAASKRMNVSEKTIEKHYYPATEQEKMESRRDYFDNL